MNLTHLVESFEQIIKNIENLLKTTSTIIERITGLEGRIGVIEKSSPIVTEEDSSLTTRVALLEGQLEDIQLALTALKNTNQGKSKDGDSSAKTV